MEKIVGRYDFNYSILVETMPRFKGSQHADKHYMHTHTCTQHLQPTVTKTAYEGARIQTSVLNRILLKAWTFTCIVNKDCMAQKYKTERKRRLLQSTVPPLCSALFGHQEDCRVSAGDLQWNASVTFDKLYCLLPFFTKPFQTFCHLQLQCSSRKVEKENLIMKLQLHVHP